MADQLDDEDAVCLTDILEEDQELEDTANAVLGDSEDSNCSYSKGYVCRQALYSCATCSRGSETAGVCLACSLHCHEGHDLYELYTKRNFRCDCGNQRFPGLTCTLNPDKEPLNTANVYGQNFKGLYCSCTRPYPDAEDQVEDEMIQCIVCEDWFHSRSHDFLHAYKLHSVPTQLKKEIGHTSEPFLDVEKDTESPSSSSKTDQSKRGSYFDDDIKAEFGTGTDACAQCELARRQLAFAAASAMADKDVGQHQPEGGRAGFFQRGWRLELCKCPLCMALYGTHNCVFLMDKLDSLAAYEQRASSRPPSHDAAVAALGSMGHIEQVEAIEYFNDLKSELLEFLKDFAAKKRVVSKRDIDGFFETMKERKRQKLDSQDGVPPAHCHF